MSGSILVINAGSASIKFSVFDAAVRPERGSLICDGECAGIGQAVRISARDGRGAVLIDEPLAVAMTHEDALTVLLGWLEDCFAGRNIVAAGHRIVHGGSLLTGPVRIDAAVLAEVRRLAPLAPLHQPHNLAAVTALENIHPGIEQIACFDTAFHRTVPHVATSFALPHALIADGIRRYGFHGLSYEYIAGVLPEIVGPGTAEGRVIVAHLGAGSSLCAMYQRKSVATTTGFTALDGLPMTTRCGTLDPGVVLYLIAEKGLTAAQVANILYNESGMLGISGFTGDMRALLESDRESAREAVELFVYRIGREIGSMAAALGGLDALVFTGGIGEHAPEIRRRVALSAAWLGIEVDERANAAGALKISEEDSRTSAWVIPTFEDLMIARHVWTVINPEISEGGGTSLVHNSPLSAARYG